MRRLTVILAALALAASLCSCSSGESAPEPVETTNYAQIITAPVTEPPKPTEQPTDSYVITAREQAYQFTDESGAVHSAAYRIPALNIETETAKALNKEIENTYSGMFDEADKAVQDKTALPYDAIDYEYYINDKIASLVIRCQTGSLNSYYRVFNYNADSDERMDNAALIAYQNRNSEITYSQLRSALREDYTSKYKYEHFPDSYNALLEKTIGNEGLLSSQMYLSSGAKLCAICTEYAGVGNRETQVMIAIDR